MTIEIMLTKGYTAIVDDVDKDLAELKWNPTSLTLKERHHSEYAYRNTKNISGKWGKTLMHRVIIERMISRPLLRGELVDHADGNGFNNRRDNLRLATYTLNNANKKRAVTNKSGFKGVTLNSPGRWSAAISENNKTIHLGYFDAPEKAHEAYKVAAAKLFGEFARFE